MRYKLLVIGFVLLNVCFLQAQELDFPVKTNLFQYSVSVSQRHLYGFPDTRIWGWSKNGKIAYSIETEIEGRGGQKIDFIIFDTVSDKRVFELKMDSFDHNDVTDEALYNLFKTNILNALKTHILLGKEMSF